MIWYIHQREFITHTFKKTDRNILVLIQRCFFLGMSKMWNLSYEEMSILNFSQFSLWLYMCVQFICLNSTLWLQTYQLDNSEGVSGHWGHWTQHCGCGPYNNWCVCHIYSAALQWRCGGLELWDWWYVLSKKENLIEMQFKGLWHNFHYAYFMYLM